MRRIGLLLGVAVIAGAFVHADDPADGAEDPLAVGAAFKGKLTQRGTHPDTEFPPEVDAHLTITRRDGNHVEVELRETMPGLDVIFLCRGQVKRSPTGSYSLEFKSHGVKGQPNAAFYLINVPYSAQLSGDSLKGQWTYRDKAEGIDLGGELNLTRE